VDTSGAGSHLGGGYEEATAREDSPFDVGEITVTQRKQAFSAWLRRFKRGVRRIGAGTIALAGGSIPTDLRQIHVDCSAAGLPTPAARPIFEPGRITLQQIRACQPALSAALAAFVETARTHDEERNELCPANPYPSAADDWIRTTMIAQQAQAAWSAPDVFDWLERSRLNAARGIGDHAGDKGMQASITRFLANMKPAADNLARLA
jgi:hypothetical protein